MLEVLQNANFIITDILEQLPDLKHENIYTSTYCPNGDILSMYFNFVSDGEEMIVNISVYKNEVVFFYSYFEHQISYLKLLKPGEKLCEKCVSHLRTTLLF